MNTQRHEGWITQLSDYVNGDVEEGDIGPLEEHLAGCASCREVLDDLRLIVAQAGALGEIEPARDLWPGIAEAIAGGVGGGEGAQVIHFPGSEEARRPTRISFTIPQLAAASVALIMVSAAAMWWAGVGVGVRVPDGAPESGSGAVSMVADEGVTETGEPSPQLAAELALLEGVLAQAQDRLDPGTVRILTKNLGVIQKAIDESVSALAVDPGNAYVRDHLERAYREKAEFLREVTTIVQWEG